MQNTTQFKIVISSLILFIFGFLKAQEPVTYEPAFPDLRFRFPVEVVSPPDGTNRFFVVEQAGEIEVFDIDVGTQNSTTFLDIKDITRFSSGQEMGLLGLAFHPDYANNRKFYVYQTGTNPSNGRIDIILAEYRTRLSNPNRANPSSRREIIRTTKNQNNSNHNGGKIGFGPDGYLYMSIGDGGGGGDPQGNAQNINNLFGAILRVDVDLDGNNPVSANNEYEIPSDNPLVGVAGRDELYAWGIRNTWKFSWDQPTGRMWGADVGQRDFEEVNLIVKGGNYGWNRFEANSLFDNSTTLVTTPDVKPVYNYDHSNNDVSITGGFVYRGENNNPLLQGRYIFADYVSGRVFSLDYNPTTGVATSETLFRTDGIFVSSFALDPQGELYFSGYGSSAQIYQIKGGVNTGPDVLEIDGIGSWEEFESGTNGIVDAIETQGENVYVAGEFTFVGGTTVSNIAHYNPTTGWNTLGGGANGRVSCLLADDSGNLYAGGEFTTIGGVSANNIAMWNGSSWSALGSGTAGQVAQLGMNNGLLYVGGTFETAGGVTVRNIATYDGEWVALPDLTTGQVGINNEIRAIAFDTDGNLYLGGNFDEAGGNSAPRIAVYNGTNWSTLGTGTSGFVQAIVPTEDYIYMGGNFALAGDETVGRITRWNKNTSTFESLGGGVSGNVNSMMLLDDFLYVGGSFETVRTANDKNYRANNVARWSEAFGWQSLGTGKFVGTDNRVNALAPDDNNGLYAGGNFVEAGRGLASNLAQWNPMTAEPDNAIISGGVYEMEPQHNVSLRLDVRGAGVNNGTLVDGFMSNGNDNQLWRFLEVEQGVYEIEPQNALGKRLGVVGENNTAQNAPIDIFDDVNQQNQRWRAIPIEGTVFYRFEPLSAPGKRLDIENVDGVPRALSRNLDNGQSQRWRLILTDIITSSIDSMEINALQVFPNPSQNGVFSLNRATNWQVFNAQGDLVESDDSKKIDLSNKTPGVYFLKVDHQIIKLLIN